MNTLWQRLFFWGWLFIPVLLCNAESKPIELKVIRNTATNSCLFLSIQEAQFHKGLLRALAKGQQYVVETSKYPVGSSMGQTTDNLERLRLFSYDELILREQALSLCGPEKANWNFTVFDQLTTNNAYEDSPTGQNVLQSLSDKFPPLEIRPLLECGASKNRIDLVFFADGYTHKEKHKFFADASRLADDISKNQTFFTVKPLLNIWAAFTPSFDSGIGVGGKPKKTPFGLFRDGTELRGVYCSKPDAARLACASMGDRCDFPILMGNDPFYGGVGGEFTVITPSPSNGALVLRHELGHSIINIGEEYDGADEHGYFGCNAANKPEEIGWAHWLTDPYPSGGDTEKDVRFPAAAPRVERMVMSLQQYPWTILNTSYSTNFLSAGTYPSNLIRFSVSGIPNSDQLTVLLDGKDIGWKVQPGIGIDRYFYEFWSLAVEDLGGSGLSQGEHEIRFILNYPAEKEGDEMEGSGPQLCSLEVLEYGGTNEFNFTTGYYGIFPTFSEINETSYRPTNEDCLMRAVTSPNFCKVCIEGLWIALMSRVDIIEEVKSVCYLERSDGVEEGLRWKRTFVINLLPLAQFRTSETLVDKEEAYEITWSRTRGATLTPTMLRHSNEDSGAIWFERSMTLQSEEEGDKQVFHKFTNRTQLVLDELDDEVREGDVISFDVRFWTEEVRVDIDQYLTGGGDWLIRKRCGM